MLPFIYLPNMINHKTQQFFCGTSNVELPVRNKGFFPDEFQDKSRLNYYASLFNSVEINSTFYKIPLPKTIERWASDVPEDFKFTFKLFRDITHAKELNYEETSIQKFFASINMVGPKQGSLLIQFPPSIKSNYFKKVRQLLGDLRNAKNGEGWKIAIEFRDSTWYQDSVYQMLESFRIPVVMHDMPKSFTPLIDMEREFIYLRFHGERGDYRGGYSADFLQEHAAMISEWITAGLPVFGYFNNTIGDAVQNALTLSDLVNSDEMNSIL